VNILKTRNLKKKKNRNLTSKRLRRLPNQMNLKSLCHSKLIPKAFLRLYGRRIILMRLRTLKCKPSKRKLKSKDCFFRNRRKNWLKNLRRLIRQSPTIARPKMKRRRKTQPRLQQKRKKNHKLKKVLKR